MEKEQTHFYKVKFTPLSRQYFFEVLEYFYDHYPIDRAEEIADELEQKAMSLNLHPHRGRVEELLKEEPLEYRFILYQRTQRADIKIIYYIEENTKIVYIIDFFPTESNGDKLTSRI